MQSKLEPLPSGAGHQQYPEIEPTQPDGGSLRPCEERNV